MSLPFSIYSYSSYIEFLQDSYEFKHQQNEQFSYDLIATKCDLKSRTLVRNIIKGIQKPTSDQLSRIAKFFKLDSEEQKYLECLHQFEQAKSSSVAIDLFQKLIDLQKSKSIQKNPLNEIEIATSLLHMTLLSALSTPNCPSASEDICQLLKRKFSKNDIETALFELKAQDYIRWDDIKSEWLLIQKHIKKVDLNPNFFLKRFHNECLETARNSLENEDPSQRYLVGANFAINEKVFPRIVQKLNAFLENLIQLEQVAGGANTVVQINMQLMKMTEDVHAKNESGLGRMAERALNQTQNTVIV